MDKEKLESVMAAVLQAIKGDEDEDVCIYIGFDGLVRLCEAYITLREAFEQVAKIKVKDLNHDL